jgi:phenylacetate-CoA ligase
MAATPYCKALARFTETTGKNLSFKVVVTSAVLLDDSTRNYIRDKFNAEVYDHYGTMETGGSLAWECPSHSGYHVNAETSLLEFIRSGRSVAAGEPGEVHVTSFCRLATPVIRYSVGDIAVPSEDECSCGRPLPLIREIQGRSADYIATKEGRYISPFTVVSSLNEANGVDQFKVTQREDCSIEVWIVTHQDDTESVTEEVERSCRHLFGETPLEVHVVEKIENSESRKFRAVESRLAELR